jgi:glycosyltransferase involved in cell wall biosynthesis
LSRVRFTGWLPTGQLGDVLRAHHLALGIFGTTPKAGRVIPSKVYDICAAGAAFVTADTPAIREVFTHLENAFLVPAGSPRHLADAILRLKSDPELRFRLAAAALKTGRAAFSQDRIGLQVLAAVTPEADDCRADRA